MADDRALIATELQEVSDVPDDQNVSSQNVLEKVKQTAETAAEMVSDKISEFRNCLILKRGRGVN